MEKEMIEELNKKFKEFLKEIIIVYKKGYEDGKKDCLKKKMWKIPIDY